MPTTKPVGTAIEGATAVVAAAIVFLVAADGRYINGVSLTVERGLSQVSALPVVSV